MIMEGDGGTPCPDPDPSWELLLGLEFELSICFKGSFPRLPEPAWLTITLLEISSRGELEAGRGVEGLTTIAKGSEAVFTICFRVMVDSSNEAVRSPLLFRLTRRNSWRSTS